MKIAGFKHDGETGKTAMGNQRVLRFSSRKLRNASVGVFARGLSRFGCVLQNTMNIFKTAEPVQQRSVRSLNPNTTIKQETTAAQRSWAGFAWVFLRRKPPRSECSVLQRARIPSRHVVTEYDERLRTEVGRPFAKHSASFAGVRGEEHRACMRNTMTIFEPREPARDARSERSPNPNATTIQRERPRHGSRQGGCSDIPSREPPRSGCSVSHGVGSCNHSPRGTRGTSSDTTSDRSRSSSASLRRGFAASRSRADGTVPLLNAPERKGGGNHRRIAPSSATPANTPRDRRRRVRVAGPPPRRMNGPDNPSDRGGALRCAPALDAVRPRRPTGR
mmetsp:Transcript_20326/g.47775  ORF Transcript_20326/g.47775 Transcript_20326/m.47775 type:complete len:334 (-) Transcript_20326:1473-2474(-)